MERRGIDPEVSEMAREVGVALERGVEGLEATRESFDTQQKIAKRLNEDVETIYKKAQARLLESDESEARDLLLERERSKEKLLKVLKGCAEEKKRLEQMVRNVEALEERATEIDTLLRRSVGAKTLQDTSQFSLADEDPLLRKFRDLE